MSRVDLTSLASKQASSKQQAASTPEMGENLISVVVLRVRPKFWWMLLMGVRDNHTRYEPKSQWWWPGMGVARAGPPFQNLQFRAKISLFLPKPALQPTEKSQMKGNSGYCVHAAKLPRAKGPSNSTICPRTAPKRPPKAPQFVHIGRRQPQTKNRPYLGLRGSKRDFART